MNRKIPFYLQAFGTNDVKAFFRFKNRKSSNETEHCVNLNTKQF
jgi:hypothetical protein